MKFSSSRKLIQNFALGLEKIKKFTSAGYTELKIVLTDWDGMQKNAQYKDFIIGEKEDNYPLNLGKYSGTACNNFISKYHLVLDKIIRHVHLGDAFKLNNEKPISPLDKNNNETYTRSCSVYFGGSASSSWIGGCGNVSPTFLADKTNEFI